MRARTLIFALPFLFAASEAAAQNGSTAGTLELYPTFHAVGARLNYSGDANANATAHLEWRRTGDASWTRGIDMTRISGARWAGSVFWLTPDSPYDVRAVIDDPDGAATGTGATRTRKDASPTPSGSTWWVATNGNDSNNGSSGSPYATIQAAANRAQPGDGVRVRAGIYYQLVDSPRSGTAAANIYLTADGAGVVLDGSDPAYLNRSDWQSDGGGVFSVPYSGATRIVAADSTQRLYRHASLSGLQTNAGGVNQGWVISGGRLYVKLEDGSSPNGHTMHVGRHNVGVYIDDSYWQVRGFEIRCFGTTSNGAAIQLLGASNRTIANNYVHTIGGRMVFLRAGARDDVLERNYLRDMRIYTWPWDATKGHEEEIQGISHRGGRGVVMRYNTFRGLFDGVDIAGGETDENVGADSDVYSNVITQTRDDAIEPETISGINTRIWGNTVNDVYSGISIAPSLQGPQYVMYNTFTNFSVRGYKCSISSVGHVYVMHNTFASSLTNTASVWPSGPYSNVHFMNNILVGNGSACVTDDTGESQTGNTFNGDLIHSNYAALFRWKGNNYSTIAALRSATGFEINGRSGDPMFTSLASGDVRLRAGSPGIDGGIRIFGVNDSYGGAAPDMGALETSGGPDITPPAAVTDLR
ncbi:MAG: hypothetical protein HOP12_11910 [Candidatus Eisenbacteria bacterium]|uniref:DUF1565 domain-containing protein n=1 Tax=Eiseniibacteriota bacterium TaxID=2212470 RepID=A0A849T0K6_UNCEI|nr:hypothetical protein [Candidatus Eisenbacteria bacterium]